MLYLIPAPAHRVVLRLAHRVRRRWWYVRRPRLSGCRVLAFDREGRVLLVRHSYGTGAWMPPGGGLQAGEDPLNAAQRELLEASAPSPNVGSALTQLDVDANELELVYRARGMSPEEANAHAAKVLRDPVSGAGAHASADGRQHDAIGTGLGAAISSFLFFATGAIIPVLPYLFGLSGTTAIVVAAVLVGIALLSTGVIVGLLSGAPPMQRALRQLLIGYGAAAVTYLLGLLVGGGVG